eukprot:jgi/Chrzof1/13214/Cz07g24200.t1
MASFNSIRGQVYDRVQRSQYYKDNLQGLTAYERHKKILNDFFSHSRSQQQQQGASTDPAAARLSGIRTDADVLQDTYRFLRTAEDDAGDSLDVRLAKRYYAKLFKEYCIADLSRYKESKVGLRWRTEQEVITGKGQFICGAKGCDQRPGLASYEVNFAYKEAGVSKQALVKLRLCPDCAYKLNYRKEKQFRKVSGMKRSKDSGRSEEQKHPPGRDAAAVSGHALAGTAKRAKHDGRHSSRNSPVRQRLQAAESQPTIEHADGGRRHAADMSEHAQRATSLSGYDGTYLAARSSSPARHDGSSVAHQAAAAGDATAPKPSHRNRGIASNTGHQQPHQQSHQQQHQQPHHQQHHQQHQQHHQHHQQQAADGEGAAAAAAHEGVNADDRWVLHESSDGHGGVVENKVITEQEIEEFLNDILA